VFPYDLALKTFVRCLQEWRKVQLKDYLDMAQEFMDELEQSESKPQA
jgi:hypothetical protein